MINTSIKWVSPDEPIIESHMSPLFGQQLYIYTYNVLKVNGFKQHLKRKGMFGVVKTFIIRAHFSYGLVKQKNFVKHLFWWNVKNKNHSIHSSYVIYKCWCIYYKLYCKVSIFYTTNMLVFILFFLQIIYSHSIVINVCTVWLIKSATTSVMTAFPLWFLTPKVTLISRQI